MSHTVLVVEDDLDIRQALMEILDEQGFAALGARDGAEALDLLSRATELPCLILLDSDDAGHGRRLVPGGPAE